MPPAAGLDLDARRPRFRVGLVQLARPAHANLRHQRAHAAVDERRRPPDVEQPPWRGQRQRDLILHADNRGEARRRHRRVVDNDPLRLRQAHHNLVDLGGFQRLGIGNLARRLDRGEPLPRAWGTAWRRCRRTGIAGRDPWCAAPPTRRHRRCPEGPRARLGPPARRSRRRRPASSIAMKTATPRTPVCRSRRPARSRAHLRFDPRSIRTPGTPWPRCRTPPRSAWATPSCEARLDHRWHSQDGSALRSRQAPPRRRLAPSAARRRPRAPAPSARRPIQALCTT